MDHRWSGWPGAWCLDCGLEDATELSLAGSVSEVRHRYHDVPHTEQPCEGCSDGPCKEPGSHRHDPYNPPKTGLDPGDNEPMVYGEEP